MAAEPNHEKTPELWAIWHPKFGWQYREEWDDDFVSKTYLEFFESEEAARAESGVKFLGYVPCRIFPPREAPT